MPFHSTQCNGNDLINTCFILYREDGYSIDLKQAKPHD